MSDFVFLGKAIWTLKEEEASSDIKFNNFFNISVEEYLTSLEKQKVAKNSFSKNITEL